MMSEQAASSILLSLVLSVPLLGFITGIVAIVALARGRTSLRRAVLFSALITTGFLVLDTLLFNGLHWLKLSFGPVRFSWIILFGLRATLLTAWLIVLLINRRRRHFHPRLLPFWLVHILVSLALVYGFAIEPFEIQVTHLQMPAPVSQLSRPLRIVQISDLHVERTTTRERDLVPLVESQSPDIILLTGDYLNMSYLEDPTARHDARAVLSRLHATYGVYAVNGSVDNWEEMDAFFSGTPVTVLTDDISQIDLPDSSLYVIGVNNMDIQRDIETEQVLSNSIPVDAYRILIHHTPDLATAASQSGVDLYLAGHTHGGQVRLPFYGAIVTSSIFGKDYEAGQYQVGDMILYVSRGLGMEGGQAPRARFLCPPEVVVIDLAPGT